MSIIDHILSHKREELRSGKRKMPLAKLKDRELFSARRLPLERALRRTVPAIIAEVKKASPSKGVLREDFDPLALARQYAGAGAAALSVLTDEKFFQGTIGYIARMRPFVTVPILRKDFIIDAYQLYQAKAFGADAVLLIAAILDSPHLSALHEEAKEIDLECLVEVHTERDLEKIDFSQMSLIGINNRDLATFRTDITTSVRLRNYLPEDCVIVSESAIGSAEDIRYLTANGIHAFLIGETLMRAEHPGQALVHLLQHVEAA